MKNLQITGPEGGDKSNFINANMKNQKCKRQQVVKGVAIFFFFKGIYVKLMKFIKFMEEKNFVEGTIINWQSLKSSRVALRWS